MNFLNKFVFGGVSAVLLALPSVASADFTPDPVVDSDLTVKVEYVGTMPANVVPFAPANRQSPVPYGKDELFLIDQRGAIYSLIDECAFGKRRGKDDDEPCTAASSLVQIFDANTDAPAGLSLAGNDDAVLNMVGNARKDKVYIIYSSLTLPAGVQNNEMPIGQIEDFPAAGLSNKDIYRINDDVFVFGFNFTLRTEYQVLYEYDYINRQLLNPRAIVSWETQAPLTHNGGAMALLPGGRLLITTGDALPFGMEGRAAAQDDNSHLSKLLIVNPKNGHVQVAAKGLRNAQRIQLTKFPFGVAFADIGGVTAEELNWISLGRVLRARKIENFGWGRNADGNAREGTFYVGQGQGFVLGTEPGAVGEAPDRERGFMQPLGQYGRSEDGGAGFVAATGPVISGKSFNRITALWGDLATGRVFAMQDRLRGVDKPVYRVNLVDENLNSVGASNSLNDIGGGRVDARFFLYPDGTAGVLFESTGDFYRLTELEEE